MHRNACYEGLVQRRKAHRFPDGLLNPSEIQGGIFDSDQLGPWSRWQGDLSAKVVVIGQDWGDLPYFERNRGVDDPNEQTCSNLRTLAGAAGWDLGSPLSPRPHPLFFTNAVLGIRGSTGKSGTHPAKWVDDSVPFLTELLGMVMPRAVVSLGAAAYRATRLALMGRRPDDLVPLSAPLRQISALSPIRLDGKPAWFPFYHCGPLGLVNRSLELQRQDWQKLGAWINHK